MVLVVAMADLALRLSKLLEGARYLVRVVDGPDLRHRVHGYQPDVLVLDWRMGGSSWRAVDEIPAIVERTATHPYVVALLPETSKVVKREAAQRGCYNVLNVTASDFDRALVAVVESALRLHRERHPIPRRVSRSQLH